MLNITVENVAEALPLLLNTLQKAGRKYDSRNGEVLTLETPVAVTYNYPKERFVMDPRRRNNPAFLVMEGLWMLAGREDVEWLARFNEQMREYSDNGTTFHGAYGHRLRSDKRLDQLSECAEMLLQDPDTRRAVASIWDADRDLAVHSKDIPCNDLIMFRAIGTHGSTRRLNMTICNRSNDLVWGMCGANAAHFSMIHEYVAARARMVVGSYTQVSNNLHLYLDTPKLDELEKIPLTNDNWYTPPRHLVPLVTVPEVFEIDLHWFMDITKTNDRIDHTFTEPFFETVAKPLFNFWMERKYGGGDTRDIAYIADDAVRLLAQQWVGV